MSSFSGFKSGTYSLGRVHGHMRPVMFTDTNLVWEICVHEQESVFFKWLFYDLCLIGHVLMFIGIL